MSKLIKELAAITEAKATHRIFTFVKKESDVKAVEDLAKKYGVQVEIDREAYKDAVGITLYGTRPKLIAAAQDEKASKYGLHVDEVKHV